MSHADAYVNAPPRRAQPESVAQVRSQPTPAAKVAYELGAIFTFGGVFTGAVSVPFVYRLSDYTPSEATAYLAVFGCAICGVIIGLISLAFGRSLHNPGNEARAINITTIIAIPLFLVGFAWVIGSGF